MIKWIAAVLGFFYMRFPGAIIGFLIGSALEVLIKNSGFTYSTSNPTFQKKTRVSPGDFELNLLSLCSIVIKSDGNISQTELDYVRSYFVRAYGKERANATFKTFNEVIKHREIDAKRICTYLRMRTAYEVRLQILHFLFGIAEADGSVDKDELRQLQNIASYLHLNQRDFDSIKAMFFKSADTAYKILEIEKSATNDEVKKAYRTMVKKYHPDKLTHMDEAYQKGAREKFNKVQEAYEQIQKERGM